MVIDWKKNIEECIRYTKIIPTFHASSIEQQYQQILIIKKLLSMHYDKTQILNWFLLAEDNCNKDEEMIEKMISLSKHRRWPRSHDFKIYITAKEVEYIKKMKATKECKSFLLTTVAYCKMMRIKKKKATFNLKERAYIYYLATNEDNYNVGARRAPYIKEFISSLEKNKTIKIDVNQTKYKKYNSRRSIISITNVIINAKWIDWDANEGYELIDLESQMKTLCDQSFEDDTVKCPVCGQKFITTHKMKRSICQNCYLEQIKKKKRIYARKIRGSSCSKPSIVRWTDEENTKLKNIYESYNNHEIGLALLKEFPNRDIKTIYNHANYIGLKKWAKNKTKNGTKTD